MHPENTHLPKNKLLSLESFIGFAAISVAFYHFRVNSHFQNEYFADFLSLGGIAVIIFMSHLSYQYIEQRFYVQKFSNTQAEINDRY